MITTAKIQSVIRQLSQFDVAVTNFQTKYNQLPGDSNLINTTGNNDGQINPVYEAQYFWSDLSSGVGLQNSLGSSYIASNPFSTLSSNATCPSFILDHVAGQPCLFAVYQASGALGNNSAGNFYEYDVSVTGGFYTSLIRAIIKPADALAIDQKIDDGIPQNGNVRGAMIGSNFYACSVNGAGLIYNVSNSNYLCEMFFKIGGTNGTTN